MNFSSQSVKHKSKTQNEDFYFDLETPRGHFFAVLDFDPHDYANLNATLKGKFETIVGSFVSLSRFSADLFLGFLAKEINNFLHNLREQAGGPELVCSAGLCLLSGNRLTYFLCGDVGISIHNEGRVLPLQGAESDKPDKQPNKLGARNQETPLTERVQTFTLQYDDHVLIKTQGLEGTFETQELSAQIGTLNSSEPKLISDALMKASTSSPEDRTLVVISGPYELYVDPALADLSKAVISLEARLNALSERDNQGTVTSGKSAVGTVDTELEQRLNQQIETLKEELRGKAGRIDLLELDEKVKNVSEVLSGKADTAEVLSLQSEVLKLGLVADARDAAEKQDENVSMRTSAEVQQHGSQGSLLLKVAGLVFVVGLVGAFAGAWLQSRLLNQSSEPVAIPVVATPQTDQITQASQPTPTETEKASDVPIETTVKPGDSLKKLARQYNVPEAKLRELNPEIRRWTSMQPGQKIMVPVPSPGSPTVSPQPTQAESSNPVTGTMEVTVAPGDSINGFAIRFKTTPDRLRELNPQITNWAAIHAGQKILVPIAPSG
jgi:LysM repeat protein